MYSHVQRSHHFLTDYGQLHVIAVCFNPMRFLSRYTLFKEFVYRAIGAGAIVHVAEASYGERPDECMDHGQTSNWKFRTDQEVWNKEAMINAAVRKLPADWKYVAWVDADVAFTNPHWVQETINQLQHYAVVQMFDKAWDLSPANNLSQSWKGFVATRLECPEAPDPRENYYYYAPPAGKKDGYWHPGYAWACRREAWDTMGGLLDINIVGGADHQMAHGFFNQIEKAIPFQSTDNYRHAVLGWESHALRLNGDIGFVPGDIMHYWHGQKAKRGYFNRWEILARNEFDPVTDLRRDWHGLWQLAGNKPQLRDDLRAYFRQRQEDSIDHA